MQEKNTRGRQSRRLQGLVVVLLVVAVGWFVGSKIGEQSSERSSASDSATEGKVYDNVAGRVLGVDADRGTVKVHHQRIEGFMEAMVMDLPVASSVDLESVRAGDMIRFDLARRDEEYQMVQIRHVEEPDRRGNPMKPPDDALERGDRVPDLELYDTRGETFRLRDMEPRRKVITFFYVRCPLEEFCPTQSRRLASMQKELQENDRDVHLLSLSLDSAHDDADALAEYAERFDADPERWTLAGADDPEAIREFARRAGAGVEVHDDSFEVDHALVGLRVEEDRIVDRVYGVESIAKMVRGM
ncbi:MAG: SCO family protein [Myxococcota bacterium]